jgi:hypothetical protein
MVMRNMLFLSLLLLASHASAETLNLSPTKWWVDPGYLASGKIIGGHLDKTGAADFPVGTDRGLGMIEQLRSKPIVGMTLRVTFAIQTTGTPTFNYAFPWDPGNTCVSPAKARLWFSHAGWPTANIDTWRWWSNPVAVELAAGQFTLTVPLDPAEWTSVYGVRGSDNAQASADFYGSLNQPEALGMVLGGGCFFGHGVSTLNGTAKLILLEYAIGQ